MKKLVSVILFLLVAVVSYSQVDQSYLDDSFMRDPEENQGFFNDSLRGTTPDVPHFKIAWRWMHNGVYRKFIPIDTLQDGVHNYNLIFKKSIANIYLANFPSPYESAIFIQREKGEQFYPFNTTRAYMVRPEDILLYNTTTPYTRISYFSGGPRTRSEEWVDAIHMRNITPDWNVGFRYNLISSIGAYLYQKSKTYNFSFFSNYEKDKINASFFINQNMGHFRENGGILNLSEIRDTIINSELVQTRIALGDEDNPTNNYMNFNLNFQLQYNIGAGKKTRTTSTLSSDSLSAPSVFSPGISDSTKVVPIQEEMIRRTGELLRPRLQALAPLNLPQDSLLSIARELITQQLAVRDEKQDSLEVQLSDSLLLQMLPELLATSQQPQDIPPAPDTVKTVYPLKAILNVRIEENRYWFKETQVAQQVFEDFGMPTLLNTSNNKDLYENMVFDIDARLVMNEHPKYTYLPGLYAGLAYRQSSYKQRFQNAQDTLVSDFMTRKRHGSYLTAGVFNVDTNAIFQFDASGELCLAGNYSGDYKLEGEITQFLQRNRNSFIKVNASLENRKPSLFLEHYFGNHNEWSQELDNIKTYDLQGTYHNIRRKTEVGVGIRNTTGYVYFDSIPGPAIAPVQYDSDLMVFTAWIKKNFKLGNFYFDQQVYYQVSNKSEVLPLPKIALYSHNYYYNWLFKNALGFQVGIDLFYNTSFYASDYVPSLMQFRNQRKEKTGNYPKADLFLVFKIKRADIFIKLEHFTQYLANKNYFSAPHYPINPMRVKYGVRWNFYD